MTNSSTQTNGFIVYGRPGCPYAAKLRLQLRLAEAQCD
ncbi:Uncharacterised protein [Mycobacteroides abscessus subsp. abscessus]|nr:Uncharacterised protein [Mycobacteroides abscessus subsp. abscessus]SHU28407.1 Uncharacterised protein [Mycobacteroides abscessus subsp. abscessus]SHV34342.1 Uncharacterised protein [Mycobacteroides abscessus subsp. abscessus]SHV73188.1 Uncharacterised protein [Mycobacteroides abscessus subsp. abscessus]SHX95034.1 Uncharacterised protein [Mycobacteroides abscessus subsp. abscessus]